MASLLTKIANRMGLYTSSQVRSTTSHAAARLSRLTSSWTTATLSIDATTRNDLCTLRARSRQLAQDNQYVVKWLSMLLTNVLGEAGMLLRNQARDPDLVLNGVVQPGPLDVFANTNIQNAFKEWGKKETCTVTGKMTWKQVNELCLSSAARDGETFAQMLTWGNKFGFTLRLFESDFVDVELNKKLTNGNEIRMGIELDPYERPVAYYMRRRHPNDAYYGAYLEQNYDRIPAEDIVHPYMMRRLHQTRGLPWSASVMDSLNMLDGYDEAALVAARVNASSHGFFKRTGQEGYNGPTDEMGNKSMAMEPGQWEELPPGLEPHVIDLGHPNGNYDQFEMRVLRGIAAGLLTSYNVLAEDMSSVNFSSMRMGLMEPREVYKMVQCWWGDSFCTPIFSKWLLSTLSTGAVKLPVTRFDKFNAPKWKGRRWPYIEPQKEVDAAAARMAANLSSLTMELSDLGIERDELLREIADDKAALDAHGLTSEEVVEGAAKKPMPQAPPPKEKLEQEDE